MNGWLFVVPVTFVASLLLTAAVRAWARRHGIVDRPDGRRKLHGRPVPLWGGVAVYGAAVLGLLAVRLVPGGASLEFTELSTAWVIAAGFVCFVGSIDDCYDLNSRLKLALQIASVLPIVLLGYYVDRIVAFGYPIQLGWLGIPLTVLWLVGCINALNLIDGMDGLASIVGLSTAVMIGVIAASQGYYHVAMMATVLTASLAGFLLYNVPPASIFLGDSGSMVIGLSLGVLGIQGAMKTSTTLAITAPAVVMTLPMFDVLAAIVRRRLTGRSFDVPDRLHIHHRLLERGWNPWQVLCLLGAICLTTGAAATAATIFRRDALAWITAMTLVVLMIRLRLFGHDEFALAKGAVVRAMATYGVQFWHFVRRLGGHAPEVDSQVVKYPLPLSGTPESRLPASQLWDILLRRVGAWSIGEVVFCRVDDDRPQRIRWMNPASPVDEDCRWSLSVSLPGRDGQLCELRAASAEPITDARELAALESLLKTFGAYFAAHAEQVIGSPVVVEGPATVVAYPEHRQAA